MEEKLEKALQFSNYRQTLNNQLQSLRVSSEARLTYAIGGGAFTIDRTLIAFVDTLIRQEQDQAVILDVNHTPVLIENLEEFLEEILSRYYEVTNDYHESYETVRKSRQIQKIVDLDLN